MSNELDNSTIDETHLREAVEIVQGGKKNVVLDATLLSALMNCARFADFRFNLNLVSLRGKSNSLECGSLAHKILETFYKNMRNGFKRDMAIESAMLSGQTYITGCPFCTDFTPTPEKPKPDCHHQVNEFPGIHNTPADSEPKSYKIGWRWVLETMQQYFDFYRNDHWTTIDVEHVKGEVLYEDDEVRVLWKAKLDWTIDSNDGIFPVDHKTMKQRRDTISLNNQFIGQCLIMRTRKVFINKIGFQTTLKPEEKFTRHPVCYSAPRLIEWQSETLPYYAKLLLMYAETGHFPPNYTHCEGKYGNCVFLGVCESDPGMREEELKLHFKVGPTWNPTNDDEG